jgi:hypothetical protein
MRANRLCLVVLLSAIASLGACGGRGGGAGAPETTIVRPRAAYELSCPDAQLAVTRISSSTYGVAGCGGRVTYTCMGGMGQYACSREGAVEGAAPVSAPVGAPDVTTSGRPVTDEVLPRAQAQLGCAEIRVYEIAHLTYAAHGCGGSMVFACMGGSGQYQCQTE